VCVCVLRKARALTLIHLLSIRFVLMYILHKNTVSAQSTPYHVGSCTGHSFFWLFDLIYLRSKMQDLLQVRSIMFMKWHIRLWTDHSFFNLLHLLYSTPKKKNAGFAQSTPYHVYAFVFPMNKLVYLGMFVFVNMWTISIHDGNFIAKVVFPFLLFFSSPFSPTKHSIPRVQGGEDS